MLLYLFTSCFNYYLGRLAKLKSRKVSLESLKMRRSNVTLNYHSLYLLIYVSVSFLAIETTEGSLCI